jgi:pyruvate ferredoxin oxidoreductase gamma subunit
LRTGGLLLVNTTFDSLPIRTPDHIRTILIDATSLAMRYLGRPITNTAMLGALAASSDIVKIQSLVEAVRREMKGASAGKNVALAEAAYAAVGGQAT